MKTTENQKEKSIASLCLKDEALKRNVFKNPECTQLVLRTIMGKDDIVIESVKTGYEVKTAGGATVRYDILARDTKGNYYDIEIPHSSSFAIPERARFYGNVIDACIINPDDPDDLPDVYIIFIITDDILGLGRPVYYTVDSLGDEDRQIQVPVDFGKHTIYVNQKIQDDTPLGKLMADLEQTDPSEFNYQILADKVRELKENENQK